MSRSTLLKVNIGQATLEVTLGSGLLAEYWSISTIGKERIFEPAHTRRILEEGMLKPYVDFVYLHCLAHMLAEWDNFVGDPSDPQNDLLVKQLWMSITLYD